MRIRVEILDTTPYVREGTYVWESGTENRSVGQITDEMVAYVLRALNEMRVLKVIR